MTSNQVLVPPKELLQGDFETSVEEQIDKYFADKGVRKDLLELWEKKLIVKELALANKRSEIVAKLNASRKEANLPQLERNFDIQYYSKEYSDLIEDISLAYALNLARKYRFANRITRIAKLNDIAEALIDRIRAREEGKRLSEKEEYLHNANIKIFAQLLSAIDEQMGKLSHTVKDRAVQNADAPRLESAEDIKRVVEATLKKYSSQLPSSVDANFADITDYDKCYYAEEWQTQHHCKYFNEVCKVQTGDMKICPHFLNKILLNNGEWLAKQYTNNGLSRKQIAELAGCKQVDDRPLDVIRRKLESFGLWRATKGTD